MKVEVLRTNGSRETHEIKIAEASKLIEALHKLAGCEVFDVVSLKDGRVMMVDDNGWETEGVQNDNVFTLKPVRAKKPVNEEATKIYHSICRPGTTHQIVGDVVIAWDEDFA